MVAHGLSSWEGWTSDLDTGPGRPSGLGPVPGGYVIHEGGAARQGEGRRTGRRTGVLSSQVETDPEGEHVEPETAVQVAIGRAVGDLQMAEVQTGGPGRVAQPQLGADLAAVAEFGLPV